MSIEDAWAAFWKRYYAGRWEPETKRLLEDTLEPGDLFVDIGAWIGPVSLWALACGAGVVAIEPDPIALVELRRVVPDDVEIWPGALALRGGHIAIGPRPEYKGAPGQFGDSMTRVSEEGVSVPCWTIQEILGPRKPKLAVMDVEGYELTLLPEVAPYLASLGCVLQVALHTGLPAREWFKDFREVVMPETARENGHPQGRSLAVVARP